MWKVPTANGARRITMTPRSLQLTAAAVALLSGCMTAAADFAQTDAEGNAIEAVEQTPSALRTQTVVAPNEFDGYCDDGVGIYLSADDAKAQLTVYVVTPAVSAVFVRPALQLTTQEGDTESTQVREFETVTLHAGESRVFTEYAEGALMDATAEVSTQ
jgi:hypothetical protein